MEFSKQNKAQVWSCGGGTQSCAIAALIVQGKLPKPDFSVIADTGYETRATWEYMDAVLVPELKKVGVELVRITGEKFGRFYNNYWSSKTTEPIIPIFSIETGKPIPLKNNCTFHWKIEVIQRYLSRTFGITKSKKCDWLGYSWDESRRWSKWLTRKEYINGMLKFPLVDLRMKRLDSIKLVLSMGWPNPPRSCCYMCPFHSDSEWIDLIKNRPDEFKKAIEFEKELRTKNELEFLHKSCIPLDQVDFSQPEDLFSRPCDSGMCFV